MKAFSLRTFTPWAVALLSLAVLAGCGDSRSDPRGLDHDETLLSLSASGEAETVPDLATIAIGVETFGVL